MQHLSSEHYARSVVRAMLFGSEHSFIRSLYRSLIQYLALVCLPSQIHSALNSMMVLYLSNKQQTGKCIYTLYYMYM